MSRSMIVSWIVVATLFIGRYLVTISRSGRNRQFKLQHFLNIVTNAASLVLGSKTIYTVMTSQNVMKLLGDDTITLCIGSSVVIWLSIQQMLKP
jgi:hypothetical protein